LVPLTRRFPRSRRQRRTRIATEGANGSRSEIAEDGKNWKTDVDVTYTKVGWIDSSRDAVLLLRREQFRCDPRRRRRGPPYTRSPVVARIIGALRAWTVGMISAQEEWEDSPEDWPQTPPYTWGGWHDNYDHTL
jgi:hypothetical protein